MNNTNSALCRQQARRKLWIAVVLSVDLTTGGRAKRYDDEDKALLCSDSQLARRLDGGEGEAGDRDWICGFILGLFIAGGPGILL